MKGFFQSKEFNIDKKLYRLSSDDIIPYLMENLWKAFWNNLFNQDTIFLQKPLKLSEKFRNKYLGGKNVPDKTNSSIAWTPLNRLLQLKKRSKRPGATENESEELSKEKELNTSKGFLMKS